MPLKRKSLIVLFLLLSAVLRSQEPKWILILYEVSQEKELSPNIIGIANFTDSLAVIQHLNQYISGMHVKGYLGVSVDSLFKVNDTIKAFSYKGSQYKYGNILTLTSTEKFTFKRHQQILKNKNLSFENLQKEEEKIITNNENNGFPFANVRFDSLQLVDNKLNGKLVVQTNTFYTFDSIYTKGNAKIRRGYLYNYLAIKPGKIYDESKLKDISRKIKEVPFLSEIKPSETSFHNGKTNVYLYLQNKKANQINGIIGVAPNNKGNSKVLVTGEVNLFLQNSIGKGELLELNWRKLELSTQQLDLHASYPYILNSRLGLDGTLGFFKQDSTYLTVATSLGLNIFTERNSVIKFFYETQHSSIIATTGLSALTVLPPYADMTSNAYGLGYDFNKLDYKFNPRKGLVISLKGSVGSKTILKNSRIPDELYQGIKLNSDKYTGTGIIDFYFNVTGNHVIKLANKSGIISGSSTLENELFRLGGIKTFRGFDENSIMASAYTIFTMEYIFLYEENSNIYLFVDDGYYKRKTITTAMHDHPYSFGIGTNFETKAGIFTLCYAIGSQQNNPIDLKTAKIHFGYINRF